MYPFKTPPVEADPREHVLRWHDHVAHGRIGAGAGQAAAQLARHIRNEEILLGSAAAQLLRQRTLGKGTLGKGGKL